MSLQRGEIPPLPHYFRERQNEFLESLRKAVGTVANDEYIQQMFANSLSTAFIPDRIIELINKIITDDREKFISDLLQKLNYLEISFGEMYMQKFENIGQHLNDLISLPILNEEQYMEQLSELLQVLMNFENELKTKIKNTGKNLNSSRSNRLLNDQLEVKNVAPMFALLKEDVLNLKEQTLNLMKNMHSQIIQNLIPSSQCSSMNFEQDKREMLKTIENQSSQIITLTKQLNSSSFTEGSNQREKLEKKLEKAKKIIQQLSDSNTNLESKQKELQDKISQLKQQLNKSNIQVSYNLDEIREENRILKEKNQNQKSKFQQRLRTLEIELQQQKDSNSKMQSSLLDEKDRIIKDLRNENNLLTSNIQNNSQELVEKYHRQQKLQDKIQEYSSVYEEQKSSIESLSSDNATLISSIKKMQREIRIQKQVNQEYAQQIDELKKAFTKTEDESQDAQRMIKSKLEGDNTKITSLMDGIKKLTVEIDQKNKQILTLESKLQSLSSIISSKDFEISKNQETIQKMTGQLKNTTQLRSQFNDQRSILVESKETIQQLHEKMEKYKSKAQELYQSLTDVSTERDDLLEFKSFGETLKKQNYDLQKELKNTKQRLAKLDVDRQTEASLSQRQYSEQLKELSRQLREANKRIQRIHTQSSRYCTLESFEDIPRALADMKQQISKNSVIVSKLKNILQIKGDDDLLVEIRSMKQDNTSLKEFLKVTSETINATTLRKCSKVIAELKEQVDFSTSREQQICQLLLIKDPTKIEKKIQTIMETNRIISRVISLLHTTDESQIASKLTELVEKELILNENGLFSNEAIQTHFQEYDSLIDEKKAALQKLDATDNLEGKVQSLIDHCNQLEEVVSILKIENGPSNRAQSLLQDESDIAQISTILQIEDRSELINTITEVVTANNNLIDEEDKIMTALAVMTPDSIIPKIDDLNKKIFDNVSFTDNLCQQLKVQNQSQINEKISKLLAIKDEYKSAKKLLVSDTLTESIKITQDNMNNIQNELEMIAALLRVQDIKHIKPTIQFILSENEEYHSIDLMFPPTILGPIKERVAKLLQMMKESKESNEKFCKLLSITKLEDAESAISSLLNSQDMASELLTKMLNSMLATDIDITFPLTEDGKTRLLTIFEDNKKRNQEMKIQIDLVLNKATNFGYKGNNCIEAVNAIVAAYSEADKQTLSAKMHEELMSVRAASENDKKAAEKEKSKYIRVINKLKQQNSQLQAELTQQQIDNEQMSSDLRNDSKQNHTPNVTFSKKTSSTTPKQTEIHMTGLSSMSSVLKHSKT